MLFQVNILYPIEEVIGQKLSVSTEMLNFIANSKDISIAIKPITHAYNKHGLPLEMRYCDMDFVSVETAADAELLGKLGEIMEECEAIVLEYNASYSEPGLYNVFLLDKDLEIIQDGLFSEDISNEQELRKLFLNLLCQYKEKIPILSIRHHDTALRKTVWTTKVYRETDKEDSKFYSKYGVYPPYLFPNITSGDSKNTRPYYVHKKFYNNIIQTAKKKIQKEGI